jgi:hypothetical protein
MDADGMPRSSRAREISSRTSVLAKAARGFCKTTPMTARGIARGRGGTVRSGDAHRAGNFSTVNV